MSTTPANATCDTPVAPTTWQRVWRHEPSTAKDDTLLRRELAGSRWSAIRDHLTETFGGLRGLSTIELGSGRGDLSALLAMHGADVTLLDACGEALDQARRRFNRIGQSASFERGDIFDAVRQRGAYDVALSSGVIEHFAGEDRTRIIRAHWSFLRPGGVAIISVPNALCVPYRAWKAYLQLRGWWPYGMEIPYTPRELTARARDAGFSRVTTCCSGFLQSLGTHWVQRIVGRRPSWTDHASPFDATMGVTLVAFCWKQTES